MITSERLLIVLLVIIFVWIILETWIAIRRIKNGDDSNE